MNLEQRSVAARIIGRPHRITDGRLVWLDGKPAPTDSELAAAWQKSIAPVTARQLRLWLLHAGLGADRVAEKINAIPDANAKAAALIEWEYGTEFHRQHPLVCQLGASLGLSPAQIDEAFSAASKF